MRSVIRVLGIVAVLLFVGASAGAKSAKHAQVRELLALTGADRLGNQVVQQLIGSFRQSFSHVSAAYWNKLAKSLDTKDLIDQIVPIYERLFSAKDLKELIAFYKTRVGKKFVKMQPQLLGESMKIGQRWGQKVAQRVAADLQRKQGK